MVVIQEHIDGEKIVTNIVRTIVTEMDGMQATDAVDSFSTKA